MLRPRNLASHYQTIMSTGRASLTPATHPSWRGPLFGEQPKELSLDITAEWDLSVRSLLELQDASPTASVHVYSTDSALAS